MAGDNDGDNDYWTCCNDDQTLFLLMYFAFAIIGILTLRTVVAKPIRVITTFCHELCHAIACWITCGTVHKIHVYNNEGGVTQYQGGCRCLIIPAGYVGVAIWAMILVILSGGQKTATFAATMFIVALLISLCYSPNRTMIYWNITYTLILLGILYFDWYVASKYEQWPPLLQLCILFLGVFIGIAAIADIYTDTVMRTVQGSDAYACYDEVIRCCHPKCIGIQWIILAIVFQLFGAWIALVQMSNECTDLGWFQCISLTTSMDNNNNNNDYWEPFRNWKNDHADNFNFDGFWDNGK